MPHENVLSPTDRLKAQNWQAGEPVGPTENRVIIGWNKIGWVQLSVAPPDETDTGDWSIADLDREGINRTIRFLRRARDQAFGKDE